MLYCVWGVLYAAALLVLSYAWDSRPPSFMAQERDVGYGARFACCAVCCAVGSASDSSTASHSNRMASLR